MGAIRLALRPSWFVWLPAKQAMEPVMALLLFRLLLLLLLLLIVLEGRGLLGTIRLKKAL